MLKNRNVVRTARMIVGCIAIVVGQYIYAEVTHIPVELKCSKNPVVSPWIVFNGEAGVRYTLTTEGLRVDEKDDIIKIIEVNDIGRTLYGSPVYVEARCIPLNEETDVSLTNSFLSCGVGEEIKVKMFLPNSVNPDKYHYVGILEVTRDGEKTQKVISNITVVNDNVSILLNPKLNIQKTEVRSI